ncbi:MAG TPA: MazG-like family protein [Rhodothermales bacterium]|nr:MazG-like family protein [Rhodothermales bacterium]
MSYPSDALDFNALRRTNSARSDAWEKRSEAAAAWNLAEWGCALAGEVGELCNLLKKHRRGEDVARERIAEEIADVAIYLDLLAYKSGIDLGKAIRTKFNADSAKRGFPHRL